MRIAKQFLADVGAGNGPEQIAELFQPDVLFEVPGDDGVLPWVGKTRGRAAIVRFVSSLRTELESIGLNVDEIVASDTRAVIVGDLISQVKANGNIFHSAFAMVLTIESGLISRYQMLEDSFAVSQAVKG
jgi:uncharacterized protein